MYHKRKHKGAYLSNIKHSRSKTVFIPEEKDDGIILNINEKDINNSFDNNYFKNIGKNPQKYKIN